MLQSQHRIRSQDDFQKVFDQGKSVANRQFVVYMLAKEGQEHIRIGISVGKKIGNAVVRNRTKRLIREAARLVVPELQWRGDLVIIARAPVVEMEFQEVSSSLIHCLKKGKLLS
ncbi:ribonuclease P protein component [Mycobacteroides abscessus]|uniref:ribonuclease P protein component n=1 Tax=Mycobacteroides abscessus TaxID=36809 RepID=UPI000C2615A9